jgi:DNA sulfur modification protein DndB
LFIDQGLKKSQQMFSDLNRHAVKVSNSLSLQYNHRDPQIGFMKDYLKSNNKLNTYIDISNDSLSQKSNKLFTLANFFTAIQNSYNHENIIIDKNLQKFVIDYWDYSDTLTEYH